MGLFLPATRYPPSLVLKLIRREFRRAKATWQYGFLAGFPILFANSFPKSGTHLLTQVLHGMGKIGPAVDSGLPAIVTFDGPTGQPRPMKDILADLSRLKAGDSAYGHLHAIPEIVAELIRDGVAPFFIYRDPRDVVVSHVHYVTEMEPDHVHHRFYAEELQNFDERLTTSISGRLDLDIPFPDVHKRFDPYLGWLDQPQVLTLRYEDFITQRAATLEKVLDHAQSHGFRLKISREQGLQVLDSAINPEKSPTFRRGKVGKWREAFTAEHKSIFKQVAGDLLVRLGYEISNDW